MLFIYRYLVTGDSYQTIAFYYCISKACVSKIVPETYEAVWTTMQPIVMPVPNRQNWCRVAEDFNWLWHFTNCLGNFTE